jgi:8-oxo-dGTP pyrophosphatase MutT (NUDIX family)
MTVRLFVSLVREVISIVAHSARSRLGGPQTRGVMCVVSNAGGEILLVKNRYRKLWSLPGGWVHPGESFVLAAEREVIEETGITLTEPPSFLAEFDAGPHLDQLFHGHRASTEVAISTPWEVSGIRWCAVDELPELALPAKRILAAIDLTTLLAC